MTDLEKMLPELNSVQHKMLERYTAEQRMDELYEAFKLEGGYYGSKDPKYSEYPASIRFQEYYDKRTATLKKEAGL